MLVSKQWGYAKVGGKAAHSLLSLSLSFPGHYFVKRFEKLRFKIRDGEWGEKGIFVLQTTVNYEGKLMALSI